MRFGLIKYLHDDVPHRFFRTNVWRNPGRTSYQSSLSAWDLGRRNTPRVALRVHKSFLWKTSRGRLTTGVAPRALSADLRPSPPRGGLVPTPRPSSGRVHLAPRSVPVLVGPPGRLVAQGAARAGEDQSRDRPEPRRDDRRAAGPAPRG